MVMDVQMVQHTPCHLKNAGNSPIVLYQFRECYDNVDTIYSITHFDQKIPDKDPIQHSMA